MQKTPAASARKALGDFLRAQRARLSPANLGLEPGMRRRTPGLKREEVAQLSGLSATWYTWIEQGREVSVSPPALARLARTLQLSPAERAYLFELAAKRDPDGPAPADDAMDAPPALIATVEGFAGPAYLLDRLWSARAWNAAASHLFVGWLDDTGDSSRNLLRYLFLDERSRALIRDWQDRARRVLAEFHAEAGRHLEDPQTRALIDDLRERSALFARFWDEQVVVGREGGLRTFDHPQDGFRQYEQVTFNLANRPEFKLVVLIEAAG